MQAGIELVGVGGAAAMTMRAVCREAQLSQKFFYESFTDTDDLLREVYRSTFHTARIVIASAAAASEDATDPAARIRAGVDAAARLVKDDPRVCRILLVEPIADLTLRHFVRDSIFGMVTNPVDPAGAPLAQGEDSVRSKMRYATVFGSIISLFLEWTEGNLGDDRDAFVDHVTDVLLSTVSRR